MNRFEGYTPIFDENLRPTKHWNVLLNNVRDYTDRPGQVLGYYAASLAVENDGFASLDQVEKGLISAARPPMSKAEKRDFRTAFGRIWAMEDGFVEAENAVRDGVEV